MNNLRTWVTLVEAVSIKFQLISQEQLHRDYLTQEINKDFWKRIKYVSHDKGEFYIIALAGEQIIGALSLHLSPREENVLWMMGISTDVDYRNQGIAKGMMEQMFQYAQTNHLIIQRSSPSAKEAINQWLPPVWERLKAAYPDVIVRNAHSRWD